MNCEEDNENKDYQEYYNISTLENIPWLLSDVSDIYFKEWGWYYNEEHNITTRVEMIDHLYNNHLNDIYIIHNEKNELIGTLMLLNTEFKEEYYPLISFLYITKNFQESHIYYSKLLIDFLNMDDLYIFVYKEEDIYRCNKLGFYKIKEYDYHNYTVYIMKKDEFILR